MTAVPPNSTADGWLEEGRRAASTLDGVSSAVVVGRDAEAVAWVALGIARAQAESRRVAIADLVGELGPLQMLVDPESDPHGISDSFLYGVSLNKIAHQADDAGNLFVLPSGSEAVAVEQVFRSDRWRRLASGFREVGALLLLVAHADTPGVDDLASSVDGIIIVGDAAGALDDAPAPLAVIAPTRRRPSRATPTPDARGDEATQRPRRPRPAVPAEDAGGRTWRFWGIVALLAATVAVALGYFLLPKSTSRRGDVPPPPDSARTAAATRRTSDSTTTDSARRGPDTLTALTIANPGDSLGAAGYSVWVSSTNTAEGAKIEPRDARLVPVIAPTPVLQDGAPTYRLLVGAYPSRSEAESLLVVLRRREVLGASSGIILRTPYALLVADRVPATDVASRVAALAKRDIAVYPLSRGDGTVALYAGAFESPDQAAWLARVLRAAGVSPTLVYRTGRSL